ncbi:MAG: transporter [Gemmatimonadaceae bacterium]|nr:transporter [Gemmatimonadaceae bacterium]
MRQFLLLIPLLVVTSAGAQAKPPATLPIQDNSFLVEEAYNQGGGVVQHISTFAHAGGAAGWLYTFTQEWPVAGQRHQVSYTVPVSRADAASGGRAGLGDVALNYRYQVGAIDGVATAFAPRVTILLPTGASERALGAGGTAVQFNLPFSAELPASLVAHSNAGATYTPRSRDALGNRAATTGYTLAQSVIWLAHPKLNLMLEAAWSRTQDVVGSGQTAWSTAALVSPGIRGAIDFASGLQIVPGLAFPFGVGPSRGERGVFAYLSFEHAFTKSASQP